MRSTFKNKKIDIENLPNCSVVAFKVGKECPEGYELCTGEDLFYSGAQKLYISGGYACYGWL